jgi:ATP-dependent Clp protease ATP-binding subunit ClpA
VCEDQRAVFERFTERARMVVVLSQEEARALRHNYIGTEHILLGLLREEEGIAARVLESMGITAEGVRGRVERIVGPSEEASPGQIPFTPRAKKVLELALREALSLGHNYIGPEHVLLGVVRENEGVGARILLDFDADSEKVRNEVIQLLGNPPRRPPAPELGVDVGLPIEIGASAPVRQLLRAAAERTFAAQRTEIEPYDLLHALAGDASVVSLLAELGVDEAALRQAIKRYETERADE